VHSTAEGSAFVELGGGNNGKSRKTKVMAAAFGPREADKSSLLSSSSSSSSFSPSEGRVAVDLRSAPFSGGSANLNLGRSRPAQTVAERASASALAAALGPLVLSSLFPKLVVDLCVVVLEDGGSALAAAALAAGAALADAGVPMSGVLGAASVVRAEGGRLLLDPSAEEEAAAEVRCDLLAVSISNSSGSSNSNSTITQVCLGGGGAGGWTADGVEAAVASGSAAAGVASGAVRAALLRRAME